MVVKEMYAFYLQALQTLYDPNECRILTQWVFADTFKIATHEIFLRYNASILPIEIATLQKILDRLLQGEPIQHIYNKAHFRNNEYFVNAYTLIPRPETEELVSLVINLAPKHKPIQILDIGTGSGIIAIALALEILSAKVFAIDISTDALAVAQQNATRLNTSVHFQLLDILDPNATHDQKFDIIVSNPPYIPMNEATILHKNVREYEPHLALFAPNNDPLVFYRAIISFASKHLSPKGTLFFECHEQYAEAVCILCQKQGYLSQTELDINGKKRFVVAKSTQFYTNNL